MSNLSIVLLGGRALVGEVRGGELGGRRLLAPAFTLEGGLIQSAGPGGRPSMGTNISVGIFCGLLSLARVPVADDAVIIPLSELCETERKLIEQGVEQLTELAAGMLRAQASGLVLTR